MMSDDVKEEICDNLCKYLEKCTPEEWEKVSKEICEKCPLNKV